jgi:hypothetical protein
MTRYLLSGLLSLLISQPVVAAIIPIVSYTYDPPGLLPNSSYPDNGYYTGNTGPTPLELRNGVIASNAYPDAQWVGVLDSPDTGAIQPRLTFDLGSSFFVSTVQIWYLAHASVAVHAPDFVNAYFSSDGISFSGPQLLTPFANPAGPVVLSPIFSLSGGASRFVRLDFFNDQQWTFLTEIQFEGIQAIPEPSTLGLLGLGLVGLAIRNRRRRPR